jgi:hypothetical protein
MPNNTIKTAIVQHPPVFLNLRESILKAITYIRLNVNTNAMDKNI